MNAGGSPRGREFATRHCDIAFIIPENPDPEAMKRQIDQYRADAREKFGREIQIWMSSYVVQRGTADEAKAYVDDYVVTQGDDVAVDELIANIIPNAQTMPKAVVAKMAFAFKAGYGGYPLVGTADDIANRMAELSRAGVDGFMMTWLDYEDGLDRLGDEVLPRLEKAGLRAPVIGSAASLRETAG
jgi:alkanesulfonate monooxygenase SsuD/methylene tetrahydromethanopterin reductase-like flavin-dependent oxidoreductase (luciferase family)